MRPRDRGSRAGRPPLGMVSSAASTEAPTPRCPTCRQPVVWQGNPARPFCSIACKLVDLGGWLDGAHRLPGPPVGDERSDPPGGAHPGPPPQADEDD